MDVDQKTFALVLGMAYAVQGTSKGYERGSLIVIAEGDRDSGGLRRDAVASSGSEEIVFSDRGVVFPGAGCGAGWHRAAGYGRGCEFSIASMPSIGKGRLRFPIMSAHAAETAHKESGSGFFENVLLLRE